MRKRLTLIYVVSVALATTLGLVYVYVSPLHSMQVTREGVAHFSPPVINPETGDTIGLGTLVRHYRGD